MKPPGLKRRLQFIYATIAVSCLSWLAFDQIGGFNRTPTIRIALLGSTFDEDYIGASALKEHVERQTNGRLSVEIFPSGQYCGSPRECIDYMQSGALDVFMTTFGGLTLIYPEGQAFDLPYLFQNDEEAECVLDGGAMDTLRQDVLAQVGMRFMVAGNTGGWRNFATTRRVVRSADDLKGVKIRTTASPIQQELVRRLGAFPTPIAWSELYPALATGVVDGSKNSVQDIISMRFEEQIKNIVLDRHSYMGALWWYSDRRWQTLSQEDKDIIDEGFRQLSIVTRAAPKKSAAEGYRKFSAAGGVVYEPDQIERESFTAIAQEMRTWYADRFGTEWLDHLDAALKQCRSDKT
ncbi:MAG: TRAP transporter substrate-binding protein DctP [Pseudomonadota bacterium]